MVNTFYVHPSDVSLPPAAMADLAGGTAADNAALIERLLEGEVGPRRDIVLLNAAAGLFVAGRAQSLDEGRRLAEDSIRSGRARGMLDTVREICAR
jgi:anthranilate phosphoribosyltransferase